MQWGRKRRSVGGKDRQKIMSKGCRGANDTNVHRWHRKQCLVCWQGVYSVYTLHYMMNYQSPLRVSEYDSVVSLKCKFNTQNSHDVQTSVEVRPLHTPDRSCDESGFAIHPSSTIPLNMRFHSSAEIRYNMVQCTKIQYKHQSIARSKQQQFEYPIFCYKMAEVPVNGVKTSSMLLGHIYERRFPFFVLFTCTRVLQVCVDKNLSIFPIGSWICILERLLKVRLVTWRCWRQKDSHFRFKQLWTSGRPLSSSSLSVNYRFWVTFSTC